MFLLVEQFSVMLLKIQMPKAFIPISKDLPTISNSNAPSKIDTPNYPDKGVAFAGFSKTLISGNEFKLNPQDEHDINMSGTLAGGETLLNTGVISATKDYYVTDMILDHYRVGVVGNTYEISIKDGNDAVRVLLRELHFSDLMTLPLVLHFSTPIKFSKGNACVIQFSNAAGAGDYILINLYGWLE